MNNHLRSLLVKEKNGCRSRGNTPGYFLVLNRGQKTVELTTTHIKNSIIYIFFHCINISITTKLSAINNERTYGN